ncbi:MAG TPA: SDR family oxidoreductase [Terriglobia bacterium]|nr:SDR family oxidoreductase [Terriglobia bacterium]
MNDARAVLITGASSGIGKASALRLAREGFPVFAGIRKPQDGEALVREAGATLHPVRLDVTEPESIDSAYREVSTELGLRGLYGLVNNAGFGDPGPIEYQPLADIRRQFEVNVFGQIAVTQIFLPLIRQAQGRIINIGSVGDRITIPFGGALCSCKTAFAVLTEALRLELRPWGIAVCLIEPASISTPAVNKTESAGHKLLASWSPEATERYGKFFQAFLAHSMQHAREGSSPDVVAESIFEALSTRSPRTRYLTGKNAHFLTALSRLPDRLLDFLRMRMFGLPSAFGELAARH